MDKNDLLLFLLTWLSANVAALNQLLVALVPVLALGVAGYALYVVSKSRGKK